MWIRVLVSDMRKAKIPALSARKSPSQARSARLVADILEAAARVLAREGARRFTTVRVAEEAGVSVGSLYQYFPSKEALLFRLQTDEWEETWSVLEEILEDSSQEPLARLRRLLLVFYRSERQEAALRLALSDASAVLRDAAETRAFNAKIRRRMTAFLAEAAPHVAPAKLSLAAELVLTSMSAVAERITEKEPSRAVVDAWASASADMYSAYLRSL